MTGHLEADLHLAGIEKMEGGGGGAARCSGPTMRDKERKRRMRGKLRIQAFSSVVSSKWAEREKRRGRDGVKRDSGIKEKKTEEGTRRRF